MEALNLGTDYFFRELSDSFFRRQSWADPAAIGLGVAAAPCLVLLLVAGMLVRRGQYLNVILILGVAMMGLLMVEGINWLIGGPRPPGISEEGMPGTSFASAGAYLSCVAFFMFAAVGGARTQGRRTAVALAGVCLLVVLGLGFLELFLRMEYLTAILAGWTAGLFMALLTCQLAGVGVPGLIPSPRP